MLELELDGAVALPRVRRGQRRPLRGCARSCASSKRRRPHFAATGSGRRRDHLRFATRERLEAHMFERLADCARSAPVDSERTVPPARRADVRSGRAQPGGASTVSSARSAVQGRSTACTSCPSNSGSTASSELILRTLRVRCPRGADRHVRAPAARPAHLGHRPLQLPLRLLHAEGGLRPRLRVPAGARSCSRSRRSSAWRASSSQAASEKIRLTGGEPLVRRDLPVLVGKLARSATSTSR